MTANRIYFAQHGLALSKEEDADRPLSTNGKEQTHLVANQLLAIDSPISQIFHSGKLRAKQTAEIFASVLNIRDVSAIDSLAPNDNILLIVQDLHIENALYVGHLPHLNKLVSCLICADENDQIITFKNSAIVCLEKAGESLCVKWLLTPASLLTDNKPMFHA